MNTLHLVLPVAALLLGGCAHGGAGTPGSPAGEKARTKTDHGDTVEFGGYAFPKAIGAYVLPDCEEIGWTAPSDGVTTGVGVSYMETNVTAQTAPGADARCDLRDPHKAVAITVTATHYPTPESVPITTETLNSAGGHYRQIGQSQCGGMDPANLSCIRVDGATVFRASASPDMFSDRYDGYRAPTQEEVAQVADTVAAAQ